MLDIVFIKENPELVKQAMLQKGEKDTSAVDKILETDAKWRKTVHTLDNLRSESNQKAKQIGVLMGKGKKDEAQAIIKETGQMKASIKELEENERLLKDERDNLLLRIPNIPHPTVPVGNS